MNSTRNYELTTVIFNPKNREYLRPEFTSLIGTKMAVRYGWTMDEDDPNPNQVAYVIAAAENPAVVGLWVPEEDIQKA